MSRITSRMISPTKALERSSCGACLPALVGPVAFIGAELQSSPRLRKATTWTSIAKVALHLGWVNCVCLCLGFLLYTQCRRKWLIAHHKHAKGEAGRVYLKNGICWLFKWVRVYFLHPEQSYRLSTWSPLQSVPQGAPQGSSERVKCRQISVSTCEDVRVCVHRLYRCI